MERIKGKYLPAARRIADVKTLSVKDAFSLSGKMVVDDYWVSSLDGSRICPTDDCAIFNGLLSEGATEISSHKVGGEVASIAFIPSRKVWVAWTAFFASHEFGVGSKVGWKKEGYCPFGYVPSNEEDAAKLILSDFGHHLYQDYVSHLIGVDENGARGVWVEWEPKDASLKNLGRGQTFCPFGKFGRGEWTAETLDDARQMLASSSSRF